MKDTDMNTMVKDIIEIKLQALEMYIEEVIVPLENIGNPEKLLKKPYARWSREDLMLLGQIYGDKPDSVLNRFIFTKEYEALKELEVGLEVK